MITTPATIERLAAEFAELARKTLSVRTHIEPGSITFTGTIEGIDRLSHAAAQLVREFTEQAEIRPGAGFEFRPSDRGAIVVRWPVAPDGFQRTAIAYPGTELHRIAVETMATEQQEASHG
jgi:2-keto-4-pentenoate hydratase/2-oxohepta-3-ene-1,7-dioic acid hydratase in catechol pathway